MAVEPSDPNRRASWLLALVGLLLAPPPGSAIVVRHDRDDARYQVLGTSYPQLVHLNTQKPGAPPDGEGTLVTPRWVVTAAHVAVLIRPGHEVITKAGKAVVDLVVVHPEWEDGPHDIALVRLARDVEGVVPARLYRGRDEAGQVVTVVGIGDTGTGLTGPTANDGRLRGATNRVDAASDLWLKLGFEADETATDLEGISGPGDSGGPAFLAGAEGPLLAGVGSGQSTRATGGREGLYGVTEYYTRVSSYLGWLDRTMQEPATTDR